MTKLDKLIDLTKLEKVNRNRRNRLEDRLRQQEYYGGIEGLFGPLPKTLTTNHEAWQAHSEAWQAHSEARQPIMKQCKLFKTKH